MEAVTPLRLQPPMTSFNPEEEVFEEHLALPNGSW